MASEISGRLDELPVREVVSLIGHSRRTGQLVFESGGPAGAIEFHDGNIVRAEHAAGQADIGTILMRHDTITETQLREAAHAQRRRERTVPLGRLLIELGYATDDDVRAAMREQIDRVLDELLALASGSFEFRAAAGPLDTITQDTADVLIEAEVRRASQR